MCKILTKIWKNFLAYLIHNFCRIGDSINDIVHERSTRVCRSYAHWIEGELFAVYFLKIFGCSQIGARRIERAFEE